jgi:aminopeptidase N
MDDRTLKTSVLALFSFVALSACGDDSSANGGSAQGGAGGTAGSSGNGGEPGTGGAGPMAAEITRYDVDIDLTSDLATLALRLDVTAAGSCFSVPSERPALAVRFDDAPALSFTVDENLLTACSASELAVGEHTLAVDVQLAEKTYHGLDIGYSTTPDLSGSDFTYLLSWVGGCDHFGPCDDDPARLVSFGFNVTHPEGTVVLCPGALTSGPTETRCALDSTLAPTYSAFSVAADAAWVASPLLSVPSAEITLYEVPGGTLGEAYDTQSLGQFLGWASERLGPLPYGKQLRLAGAPTAWLGFEHPANIILHEELDVLALPYVDATMHVTMHEIVHQWSGDATTLATPQDFAWKEAIAEYLPYVFEDEQRPLGEAQASLAYWDGIAPDAQFFVRPMDEPPPKVETFYGDVYGPGPMILFVQLEDLLGREAVLLGITNFLAGGGVRSVAELQQALEAASGVDLAPYFNVWVFGSGAPEYPRFTVETADNGDGSVAVTVTQTNAGAVFPCSLQVAVTGATASAVTAVEFPIGSSAKTVTVDLPFSEAVVATEVDPNHRVVNVVQGAAPSPWPVYIF